MKKRKGKFSLIEALNFLDEAIYSGGYPDNGIGGISTDDDYPPGNIVYGDKYKKIPYFNKLTDFEEIWDVDSDDWKWDEFEKSTGMEDFNNYSNTLNGMEKLFPKKTWNNIWKRMKNVPDRLVTLRFKKAGQPWRKGGKDQLGVDKEDHIEIDAKKDGAEFKNSKITDKSIKENNLINRLNILVK